MGTFSWQNLATMGMTAKQVNGALIILMRTGNFAFIAWAFGMFAYLGLGGGFARSQEQSDLQTQVEEGRLEYLATQYLSLRIEQCNAIANELPTKGYTVQINTILETYYGIAGKYPRTYECSELT
jgi:hypothetical protein